MHEKLADWFRRVGLMETIFIININSRRSNQKEMSTNVNIIGILTYSLKANRKKKLTQR